MYDLDIWSERIGQVILCRINYESKILGIQEARRRREGRP